MGRKLGLLLLFMAVAFAEACHAAFDGNRPYVVNYARDKYRAANKNWAVEQDERGVMYVGNDAGLLVSDGMEWDLYPMPGVPIVRALAVESHNTIYVGGTDELGRWDRDRSGRLRYTSLKKLLPGQRPDNESFWRVHIDGDYVYFQSFSNIYVYHRGEMRRLTRSKGFLFMQQVGDECWVQEMYGELYRLKDGQLTRMAGSEFLTGSLARVILPYGKDCCLVGTSDGRLYLYKDRQFTRWNPALSRLLAGKELNCAIYSPSRDIFYLGTLLDGIYEVDAEGNVLNHFYAGNTLQNNTVLYLYEDRQHNVWAALDRGISYIHYTPGMDYYQTMDPQRRLGVQCHPVERLSAGGYQPGGVLHAAGKGRRSGDVLLLAAGGRHPGAGVAVQAGGRQTALLPQQRAVGDRSRPECSSGLSAEHGRVQHGRGDDRAEADTNHRGIQCVVCGGQGNRAVECHAPDNPPPFTARR